MGPPGVDVGALDDVDAVDDVHGGTLPPELVRVARALELGYLAKHGVYEYVSLTEARRRGLRPIRMKWIDTNKGEHANPLVRSRLVCTEVRRKGWEPIFVAAPPLDRLKALIGNAALRRGRSG